LSYAVVVVFRDVISVSAREAKMSGPVLDWAGPEPEDEQLCEGFVPENDFVSDHTLTNREGLCWSFRTLVIDELITTKEAFENSGLLVRAMGRRYL
jgi:hypothetical protein